MRIGRSTILALSFSATVLLVCGLAVAKSAPRPQIVRRTVWNGVYTAEQAEKGKEPYKQYCARCHAANFDGIQDAELLGDFGPRYSIRGTDFMDRWREDSVQSLYTLIAGGMPPRAEPKAHVVTLEDSEYLSLTAYILQGNGFPVGKEEMTLESLPYIRIQERSGPKPLPSFSTIQVVGCLKQLTPGVWELAQAGEPMRLRELAPATDEELKNAEFDQLGNLEFDLQSMGILGREFSAIDFEGHKMQARGVLIRQPPNVRIDVRFMSEVSGSCQ